MRFNIDLLWTHQSNVILPKSIISRWSVSAGLGILEMEIYLLDTRLFMIVEVPVGFDWNAAMERLATLPRQQEWEDYMAIFQLVKPGSTAAEKWQPMERIFHLYD